MNFIANLIKGCIYLVIYGIVFALFVWILLGISPQTTWDRFSGRVKAVKQFITGSVDSVSSTVSDMAGVAKYHMNQASAGIDGKDPYERVDNQLSDSVQ